MTTETDKAMKKRNGAKAQVMTPEFRTRTERDRTKYTRKKKHRKGE